MKYRRSEVLIEFSTDPNALSYDEKTKDSDSTFTSFLLPYLARKGNLLITMFQEKLLISH